MKKLVTLVAAGLVFAFILYLAITLTLSVLSPVLSIVYESSRTSVWPTVRGIVTQSSVGVEGTRGKSYLPKVAYSYEVAGTAYTGNRVRVVVNSSLFESSAQATVARYVVGQPVTIHYDLSHPNSAVLEPGLCFPLRMTIPILYVALGWFVIAVCAWSFYCGLTEPPSLKTTKSSQQR